MCCVGPPVVFLIEPRFGPKISSAVICLVKLYCRLGYTGFYVLFTILSTGPIYNVFYFTILAHEYCLIKYLDYLLSTV